MKVGLSKAGSSRAQKPENTERECMEGAHSRPTKTRTGSRGVKAKEYKKKNEDSKTKLMHLKILGSFYGSQKQEGNTGNENRRRADAPDEAVIEIIISGILFL